MYPNYFDPGDSTGLDAASRTLVQRRANALGPHAPLMYRHPVHLVRGRGTRLWDSGGREYLDAYNNVPSVGHSHPHVAEAVSRQVSRLNTHSRYLHEAVIGYAERLLARLPDGIGRIGFQCTGSEANDLAVRMARYATGARGVIVTRYAYHGNTALATALSPASSGGTTSADFVRLVEPPLPGMVGRFHAEVAEAVADLTKAGLGVAALLADSSFSSEGIVAGDPGILGPALETVRGAGGLFIADEVQPGFGRIGTRFWGFALHEAIPDIVTMGKPMAAGLPVAAVAARPDIADRFYAANPYFNTFAASPVSMAAATAVLDVIETEELAGHAEAMGESTRAAFRVLAADFPVIADVRGSGLYTGVELRGTDGQPDGPLARSVVESLRDQGVLLGLTGVHSNVLKVRPPLPFDSDDLDLLASALARALRTG